MNKFARAAAITSLVAISALGLSACDDDDAKIASENVSKAADNFEVQRNIVFVNGITDKYLLQIEGRCSIDDDSNQLEVICKTGPQTYKKHFLGLSDNVTYFVEQTESVKASAYHYRVTWKPQSVIPDVDFRGSTSDGPQTQK